MIVILVDQVCTNENMMCELTFHHFKGKIKLVTSLEYGTLLPDNRDEVFR